MSATAEIWGRIYAVIDNATPGGMTATALQHAGQEPGLRFAAHHNRVARRIANDDTLASRMGELLPMVDADAMQAEYGTAEQGFFLRGLYAERGTLPPPQGGAPGRPKKGSPQAIDWSAADWGKGNADIARDLGVSRQGVAVKRERLHKRMKGE